MIKIINSLIKILILKKVINPNDKRYFTNILMAKMQLKKFSSKESEYKDLLTIQNAIGNYAEKKFKINKADFINEIMSLLIDRPSEVQRKFEQDKKTNPHQAFLNYYALSQDSYYIKPTIQTVSRIFL